jgi:sRNA-binding protein
MTQDHNEVIQILCDLYPKAFFGDPRQRRPLKRNIVADLSAKADKELAYFDVGAAVDWYCNHIGYDYAHQAGKERVNLDGEVIGKITVDEAREAQQRIDYKHEMMDKRKQRSPHATLAALHNGGEIPDDQMRKVTALKKAKAKDTGAKLDEAIAALTQAKQLLELEEGALRTAMLQAAIGVASKAIGEVGG